MSFEALNLYIEVDPNTVWTQTATRNTCVNLDRRNDDSYIYKSYGADYFTDYTHNIDFYLGDTDAGSWMGIWAVSNDPGSYVDMSQGQMVYLNDQGANTTIVLRDAEEASLDPYSALSDLTPYYLIIERNSTTLTCKIYSDSERTSLVDTLTVTCVDTAEEYALCGFSRDATSGDNDLFNGYCENFDFHIIGEGTGVVGMGGWGW